VCLSACLSERQTLSDRLTISLLVCQRLSFRPSPARQTERSAGSPLSSPTDRRTAPWTDRQTADIQTDSSLRVPGAMDGPRTKPFKASPDESLEPLQHGSSRHDSPQARARRLGVAFFSNREKCIARRGVQDEPGRGPTPGPYSQPDSFHFRKKNSFRPTEPVSGLARAAPISRLGAAAGYHAVTVTQQKQLDESGPEQVEFL
jgi:hypothetical protein